MARPKYPFIENKELQELILTERRVNFLTIREIAEKYPQYSVVTYKRFLRSNCSEDESAEIEKKARNRLSKTYSQAQIDSWNNRDSSKKDKQIKHLRILAKNQRGVKTNVSPEGKEKQRQRGREIGRMPESIERMKRYANSHVKYTAEDLLKIIENSGAKIVGDAPKKADDYVQLQWEDGKTRRCMVKQFIKLGYIPKPSLSIPESEIMSFVSSIGFSPIKIREDGKEIDVFIKEKSVGIEHNGLFWHNEENKDKYYHKNKTDAYAAKGIHIIHIWEHEWAYKREQVKNFLRSKLGVNKKIYARKCVFKIIDKTTAKVFCNENHIQGYPNSSKLSIGCFYKDELVGVAVFGVHHRNNKENILSRLCFKHDINVIGALSKFTKMAVEEFQTNIFTWCDLRLSDGSSYVKAGWEIVAKLPVDYFYWVNGLKTVSKQSRKKSNTGTTSDMTEKEQAEMDGLSRVWDCGKIKLIFKKRMTK